MGYIKQRIIKRENKFRVKVPKLMKLRKVKLGKRSNKRKSS